MNRLHLQVDPGQNAGCCAAARGGLLAERKTTRQKHAVGVHAMKKQSRKKQLRLDDRLDLILLTPESEEVLGKLLDGGWGNLDLPGFDLEELQALDFEWLETELSSNLHSFEPGAKHGSESENDGRRRRSRRQALGKSGERGRGNNRRDK